MLIHTDQFWSYLINEPPVVIAEAKRLLTFVRYNFDAKKEEYDIYWQKVFDWNEYTAIRFPTGMCKRLLDRLPIQEEIKKDTSCYKYITEDVQKVAEEVKQINPKFEIRDYQIKAALTALNNFNCIVQSSTGSGKSSVISMVCKILKDDKILITNGNNIILQQIYERLLSFGITNIGWNPSCEPDYDKRIVLINTATSDSRLNSQDEKYINFLKTVNTWCIDECQHFSAITGFEPVFYMDEEKLKRIIGFSATPFRRYDAPYDNDQDFRLIALLGEPKFKYEMQDTIADNNIAQPYGYFIRYKNYTPNLPDKFKKDYFMQYRMGITYNKARNAAGLAMLKYLSEHNVITLACVNKIKNGQKIIEELTKQGIKCKMICGNQHGRIGSTIFEYKPNKRGTLKLEEIDGTVEDLEKAFDEGYNVIVGTSVLQEGADVQRFQAVVLFTGAKDYIGSTQMIGRAVRKKKTGKNIALVIDFNDHGGIPILAEHCNIRAAAMRKNGVKIIEKVQDFCKLIDSLNEP